MASTSECRLDPIDLHDADQFSELQRQRVLCGWDYDPEILKKWKKKQEEKLKNLFWITINLTDSDNASVRAGHISLNADTSFDPPELRNLPHVENCVLSISAFYILPKYRSGGLGQRVMQRIEEMAVQEPYGSANCRFIALNAMSKRHMYDDGREWRGIWERMGMSPPSFSIQEWYEMLGYVSWKEEPLHEQKALDGGIVKIWEAFMRKEISK
jgi:GNAT superfamily N-acetyltransferase